MGVKCGISIIDNSLYLGFWKMVKIRKESIEEIVKDCNSKKDIFRKLKLSTSGSNYKLLDKVIKENFIDIKHFFNRKITCRKYTLEEALVEDSKISRSALKKRLLKVGLLKNICQMCGQEPLWFGKTMYLILDHINGIREDNRLENLRILCPNCNATLDTNGGKNIRAKERFKTVAEKVPQNECKICHSKTKNKKYCSRQCFFTAQSTIIDRSHTRKVKRPSVEELNELVQTLPLTKIGIIFGVSDNAVRKWIKKYQST